MTRFWRLVSVAGLLVLMATLAGAAQRDYIVGGVILEESDQGRSYIIGGMIVDETLAAAAATRRVIIVGP